MSPVSSTASQGYLDHPWLAMPTLPSGLLQQLLMLMLPDLLSAPLKY
jgi:hypothetical protein